MNACAHGFGVGISSNSSSGQGLEGGGVRGRATGAAKCGTRCLQVSRVIALNPAKNRVRAQS